MGQVESVRRRTELSCMRYTASFLTACVAVKRADYHITEHVLKTASSVYRRI